MEQEIGSGLVYSKQECCSSLFNSERAESNVLTFRFIHIPSLIYSNRYDSWKKQQWPLYKWLKLASAFEKPALRISKKMRRPGEIKTGQLKWVRHVARIPSFGGFTRQFNREENPGTDPWTCWKEYYFPLTWENLKIPSNEKREWSWEEGRLDFPFQPHSGWVELFYGIYFSLYSL